jgi:hypothetical protein
MSNPKPGNSTLAVVARLDGRVTELWIDNPSIRMIYHLDPGVETKIQATCLDPLAYKEVKEFEP